MGWYFTPGITRDDLVKELVTTMAEGCTLLAHQVVVENGSHVLWSAVEMTPEFVAKHEMPGRHLITCNLLEAGGGGWGYKPMDEFMGPYFYSVPLHYFELAPGGNEEWRNNVRVHRGVPVGQLTLAEVKR